MKCPACERDLTSIKLSTMTVEACQGGCGGIWFHAHELQKVEYQDELEGEPLLHINKDENVKVDHSKKRKCPNCNMIMMQHFFSPKRQVSVDECPKCAGFWLDAGELSSIRSEFHSEAERQASVDHYFNDVFGAQLNKDQHDYDAKFEKVQKATKLFSFICPSHYLTSRR